MRVLRSALVCPTLAAAQPGHGLTIVASRVLKVGGGEVQVDFAAGPLDLSEDTVVAHVQAAASAIVAYYGRFPVDRARVLIVPVPDGRGICRGRRGATWPGTRE